MRNVSVWVAILIAVSGHAEVKGQEVTLDLLRQKVASNEALIARVKLDYTVQIVPTERDAVPGAGGRVAGRSYSHYEVTWAQNGPMQYTNIQHFYGPNEPANYSTQTVLNNRTASESETLARTSSPRLPHVTVGPTQSHHWYHVLTAKLRMRPFEDQQWLSEALTPLYATLHSQSESVEGRPAYVVDLIRPDRLPSVVRVWIDVESAIPIRTCYYYGHPDAPQASLTLEVNDVTPYRLPNGGWIPISGVRTVMGAEYVTVDVDSITTDVPESLFLLEPPAGGTVYDARTGLTSVVGGAPKTYDQIISGADRFIAGTVTDAEGMPLPDVVVALMGVTTQQADGRTQTRPIPFREAVCGVTDSRGRFALECGDGTQYRLSFRRSGFVEARVEAVPGEGHALTVALDRGGSVSGRVFFATGAQKVPVGGAQIRLLTTAQGSRKVAITDEQGRFELTEMAVRKQAVAVRSSEPARYAPGGLSIACGPASETVTFDGPGDHQEIEILITPDVTSAAPLVGKSLPDLVGLGLDITAGDIEGRRVLVCFFDMEQRPARRSVMQLAEQAAMLEKEGVVVLAVHDRGIDAAELRAWADESRVSFPLGTITDDPDIVKFTWAVRSLPWLILTDRGHMVEAEGFSTATLDELLRE